MIKKFTLLLLIVFSGYEALQAQMFMGGWIEYRHLNNYNYEVQLHVFRDCSYGALPQPKIIVRNLLNSTNIDTLYFKSGPVTYDVYQKNLLGNSLETRCEKPAPSKIGIKRLVFKDTLSFIDTTGICNILLSYFAPNYSNNFGTIAPNQTAKLELNFNACGAFKTNSSPIQNIKHLVYFNHNNRIKTSYASIDSIDQDSINYVLEAPLTNFGAVNYNSGSYSKIRFITFLGYPNNNLNYPAGLKMDAYGNIGFLPTRKENGLVGIKVTEYGKINGYDVEISSGIRVFPIIVDSYDNSEADYTHSLNPISITACQSNTDPYQLEINFQDNQSPPIVNLSSSFGPLTHEIKRIDNKKILLNIYFDSIVKSKISNYSTLILNIVDTSQLIGFEMRPLYLNQSFNLPIKLGQDSIYNITTSFDSVCNIISYSRDKIFGNYQNVWEIIKEDSIIYKEISNSSNTIIQKVLPDSGWHRVKASTLILGCQHVQDTLVYVKNNRQKLLSKNFIECTNDTVTVNVPTVNRDNNWNYSWVINNNIINNNSLSLFFDSAQYLVYKVIGNNSLNGCKDSVTGYLFISDYKKNSPDSFKICGNQIFNFTSNASSKYGLQFDFNNQGYANNPSTSINVTTGGTFIKNYKVNEGFLCFFNENIVIENLLIQPIFKADSDTSICSRTNNGFINFSELVNDPDSIIKYEYASQITSPENSIPIQNGKAFLRATHISGCTSENEYLITVLGSTHIKNDSLLSVCRGIGNGLFTANSINLLIDTFGFITNNGINLNQIQFDALNTTDSQFIFYTKFQGCETYDTIKIVDFEYNSKLNVPDQLCNNQANIVLQIDSGFYGGEFYLNDTLLINTLIPSSLINNNYINYKSFINAHIQCEQKFNFNVNPAPTADFSADITDGLKPLSVNFSNNSSDFTSFKWLLPNSVIDSVNNPLNYVFNDTGKYDIGIIVSSTLCGTDTLIKTNYINVRTNLSKPTINSNINVYPNPTNHKLFVELVNKSNIKYVNIYDLQGKILFEKNILNNQNSIEIDFDLPASAYLLEVKTDNNEVYYFKFIVGK